MGFENSREKYKNKKEEHAQSETPLLKTAFPKLSNVKATTSLLLLETSMEIIFFSYKSTKHKHIVALSFRQI